jgi:hypothetical protein
MKNESIFATLILAVSLFLTVCQLIDLSHLGIKWKEIDTYTDEKTWTWLIPLFYYAALLPGGLLLIFLPKKAAVYLLIVIFMTIEEVALTALGLSTTLFPTYAQAALGLLTVCIFYMIFSPRLPQVALTGKTSLKGLAIGAALSLVLSLLTNLFF